MAFGGCRGVVINETNQRVARGRATAAPAVGGMRLARVAAVGQQCAEAGRWGCAAWRGVEPKYESKQQACGFAWGRIVCR